MVSGIRWFAASGAMGGTLASLYAAGHAEPLIEIFQFEASATNSPNRVGFFGVGGAPNSPVVIGLYQDRTHRCDYVGVDKGSLVNVKYTGASSAEVSGVSISLTGHTLATIPQVSGTLLLRFKEPNLTAVVTQNALIRAINLTATSGAPDIATYATNITVQAAQLADTAGNAGNASWTAITSADLNLNAQSLSAHIHDFHILLSASPVTVGRKTDWAIYCQLEYL